MAWPCTRPRAAFNVDGSIGAVDTPPSLSAHAATGTFNMDGSIGAVDTRCPRQRPLRRPPFNMDDSIRDVDTHNPDRAGGVQHPSMWTTPSDP